MTFDVLLQQLFNGLTLGGMFALVALGYTMVYGILELVNFAHGEIFMVGAFLAMWTLQFLLGSGISSVWVALPIALMVSMTGAAILGVVVERVAYRPLRRAPRITILLSAIGVSIVLQNAMMLLGGRDLQAFPQLVGPEHAGMGLTGLSTTAIQVGGATFQVVQGVIVVVSVALMLGLDYFVNGTRMGRGMRATAQDPGAAQMMGIEPNRIVLITFIIGSALAAAGGTLAGLYYGGIKFNDGFVIGLKAFTAAVLGGVGNIRGAMLGGFILGLCETVLVAGLDVMGVPEAFDYKDAITFLILVAILTLRPAGLLGRLTAEKV